MRDRMTRFLAPHGDHALGSLDAQRLVAEVRDMQAGHRPGLGFTRGVTPSTPMRRARYSILTPTGDRAAAFYRCLQMVASQSLQPLEWIVVDDGVIPLSDQVPLPDWVTYVRRQPAPSDPPHTLSLNVLAGLEHITTDRVLIVEDDDWYSPHYAEYLLPYLDSYGMVGLNLIRYYHLRGSAWKHGHPPAHTAFAQTAFRRGHAWDHLAAVCRTNFTEIREMGIVDRHWWQTFEGTKYLVNDHPCLHVGLKGGFGRRGLASGHDRLEPDYIPDADGTYLKAAIGPDCAFYNRWRNAFSKPYVIYTAVIGDQPLPDISGVETDAFDLVAFCDHPRDAPGWQVRPFDRVADTAAETLAHPRALPHLWFPECDWSLWIDPAYPLRIAPARALARAAAARTPVAYQLAPCLPSAGQLPPECSPEGHSNQVPMPDTGLLLRRHNDPQVAMAMAGWARDPAGTAARLADELAHAEIVPLELQVCDT